MNRLRRNMNSGAIGTVKMIEAALWTPASMWTLNPIER
jgi:hypothetical protein